MKTGSQKKMSLRGCWLLLSWFCLHLGGSCFGQTSEPPFFQFETERLSIEEGLSSRDVRSVIKDRQGFIWISTQNGVDRFDGYEFLIYDNSRKNPHKIPRNNLFDLMADTRGNLLLLNFLHDTLDVLDPVSGKVDRLPFDASKGYQGIHVLDVQARDGQIYSLAKADNQSVIHRYEPGSRRFEVLFKGLRWIDSGVDFLYFTRAADGTFWVAYDGTGHLVIHHADSTGQVLHRYTDADFNVPLSLSNKGVKLYETADGVIWIRVLEDGLFTFDPGKDQFIAYPGLPKGNYDLFQDSKGNLLIFKQARTGEKPALFKRTDSGTLQDYSALLPGLPQITAVFSDDFDSWVIAGTTDGIWKFNFNRTVFEHYLAKKLEGASYGMSIRGMTNDPLGRIVIGTELAGIYDLDPATGQLSRPGDRSPALAAMNTLTYTRNLVRDGDLIWIPHHSGLLRYNPVKNTADNFEIGGEPEGMAIGEDGKPWLALLNNGLVQLDPATGTISEFRSPDGSRPFGGQRPTYLIRGRNGILWAGLAGGLARIDPVRKTSVIFPNPEQVTCISETPEGFLWIATLNGGLKRFDPDKNAFSETYTREDGLGSNQIAGILPDREGNLWLSTYSGLSWFEPRTRTFLNFFKGYDFSHYEFNRHSFFYDKASDKYYFGGMNGVNAFAEKDLFRKKNLGAVLISEIGHFDPAGKVWIRQQDGFSGPVYLPPSNRSLIVRLTLTDYENPKSNQFSYMIQGLDETWKSIGQNREIRLDYLPYGNYTLHVRGADPFGNWSGREGALQITVGRFWYQHWWVWLLLATVAGYAVYYFYRFQLGRRIAEKEALRLQELDAFKSRFFTNITHEFRTPLTVILGISEQWSANEQQWRPEETGKKMGLIRRNGENLLRLINQILDLAKLEDHSLRFNYVQADLLPYLRYIVESLHSLANSRNVMLRVETREAGLVMDFDPERLLQIVYNLLSNAIKFTPDGGKVILKLSKIASAAAGAQAVIAVSDNGIGIAGEELPHIFNRYYQADNLEKSRTGGTGIGLALTRELVRALGGDIGVESEVGKGTTFTVVLPVKNEAETGWEITGLGGLEPATHQPATIVLQGTGQRSRQGQQQDTTPQGPHLLLIEDNPDVVEYLTACLEGSFRLDFAYNGRAGIDIALEQIPDIVISDVMMPEKDGFEVCNTLKNDERTSHIPIVLLTAKADVESRIAGLKRGADAYLAKPFHQPELQVILENLLSIRKKLQSKYAIPGSPAPASPQSLPDPEDAFLQKVRSLVENNLSDPDFEMLRLERGLSMSRSQIFRKVKALTGRPPVLYVRSIRLHRSKELLAEGRLNVSEIAYEVGFSSPVYFSNAFLEEFGVRPSEWRG